MRVNVRRVTEFQVSSIHSTKLVDSNAFHVSLTCITLLIPSLSLRCPLACFQDSQSVYGCLKHSITYCELPAEFSQSCTKLRVTSLISTPQHLKAVSFVSPLTFKPVAGIYHILHYGTDWT
jgi:hypothetical protein